MVSPIWSPLFKAPEKKKFEAELNFFPRAFFFSKDFSWKEFLWRVEEVSLKYWWRHLWPRNNSHNYLTFIWPLQIFVKRQCAKRYGGGLIQKSKWWEVFPLGFADGDIINDESIFRMPYDTFERFLKVPLKNRLGEVINSDAAKKRNLKEAFGSLGTFFFNFILINFDFLSPVKFSSKCFLDCWLVSTNVECTNTMAKYKSRKIFRILASQFVRKGFLYIIHWIRVWVIFYFVKIK